MRKIEIEGNYKIYKIGDNILQLRSVDSKFDCAVLGEHEQECCERVFIDFEAITRESSINLKNVFSKICFKSVKHGLLLTMFDLEKEVQVRCFIPCYAETNGYYSDELDLRVEPSEVCKGISRIYKLNHKNESI